jgi:hypothetical protein
VYAGDVSAIQMQQHIIFFGQLEIAIRSIIAAAVKLSLQFLYEPIRFARVQYGQWMRTTAAKQLGNTCLNKTNLKTKIPRSSQFLAKAYHGRRTIELSLTETQNA